LRVAYAGTPAFACPALEAIAAAGHEIPLVVTQPDRPAGRGMRLTESAVAQAARALGLKVAKPPSMKTAEGISELRAAAPDVLVVAAYGLILPRAVLDLPRRGCVNIHASLLPRWRGAAPIQRALLAGDRETGVCIMQMEEGLDTGPVLLERSLAIGPRDTSGTLTESLARLGAEAITEALLRLDEIEPRPQDSSRATYAAKFGKEEARIDWALDAAQIDRQVRAFNPAPGAEAEVQGVRIKVWDAEMVRHENRPPGSVIRSSDELVVGCGRDALRLLVVQRAGARRMPAPEFLRGNPWPVGPQAQ
jgi:methionyl-tRNA formyltransferase